MKKLLITLVFSIILLVPLLLETAAQETELITLQSGIISTSSNDYEISDEFDIRVIGDGDIIRMKGITVSGHPYYVYQKMVNDEPTTYGKIFINNLPVEIIHKKITKTETMEVETAKESIQVKKNFVAITDLTSSAKYYERFFVSVKVYDADINPNPLLFSKTDGLLKDIPIQINITDSTGKTIDTFEGNTDKGGTFYDEYFWKYNDITGSYTVLLDINDGDYTESFTTYYLGHIQTNSTG